MTRPSRMLLVVGIFAVLAIVVLGLMARRYGSILQRRAEAAQVETERTLRRVDGFIRARRALSATADSLGDALEEAKLTQEEYVYLDRQYRDWKNGRPGLTGDIAAAFELRRNELAASEPRGANGAASRR